MKDGYPYRPTPHTTPILFSGPMVRAILAGRKTQTRRFLAPGTADLEHLRKWDTRDSDHAPRRTGDRMWVKETFATDGQGPLWFRADGDDQPKVGNWRPSIHMPRWASRITLELDAVRVERLNEISEADATAEGVTRGSLSFHGHGDELQSARSAFRELWDSINAKKHPWHSDPWVWVLTFHRI